MWVSGLAGLGIGFKASVPFKGFTKGSVKGYYKGCSDVGYESYIIYLCRRIYDVIAMVSLTTIERKVLCKRMSKRSEPSKGQPRET